MSPLQGLGVLVTRPEQQAMPLCRLLEAQGAHTLRLPAIEIRPYGGRNAQKPLAADLGSFELIVFVSANAVRFGAGLLQQRRDLPLAAIGPATAKALNQAGYRVAIQPRRFDTEGLLEHPQVQHLAGRSVLLIKGRDGRMLLEQELTRRGAQVLAVEVYERVAAAVSAAARDALRARLAAGEVQVITATSLDVGNHLLELAHPDLRPGFERLLWLVPGERVAAGLRQLGLRAPILPAASAEDQDLVSALLRWRSGTSSA